MTPEQQAAVEAAVKAHVDDIWAFSEELYQDAMRCNAGESPCERGKSYGLTVAEVAEADLELVKKALTETSLPTWAAQCEAVNPGCEATWRATVGAGLGL